MKATKPLLSAINKIDFPEYIIEQLSDNPDLILTGLKRICKPPHIKKGYNPKDTKTKYGLLYVSYNNAKKKHNVPNYDGRYKFIDMYLSDKNFGKLFKQYKKSNFDRNKKPSLNIIDKHAENPLVASNLEFITYDKLMKKSSLTNAIKVTEFRNNKPYKLYNSIGEAHRESKNSTTTIRYHLGKEKGTFRYTTQDDIDYIAKSKENAKKLKKMLN